MDPRCRINLLGSLSVVQAQQTITRFRTQKAASLLAYLALRPGPHSREQIIDLFWPDMDLAAGRSNLSTTLSGLRRRLESPGVRQGAVLVTTHAQIGLDPAAVTTDVAEFERFCDGAETADGPANVVSQLERAAALYVGDFQEGNFQDWAVRESERLHTRFVRALDLLGDAMESLERFEAASGVARLRVAADPYTEEAHIALIRRLVRAGQRVTAREAAHRFETLFQKEYNGLDAESRRTVAALLGDVGFQETSPAALRRSPKPMRAVALLPMETPLPAEQSYALPPEAPIPFWLSRFFGREDEMLRLASLLLPCKGAGPRLTTLTGPGGAGKTRLASEFARRAGERLGLWRGFVSLADLRNPGQIPTRVAQSLRLPPGAAPEDRIASFFAERGQNDHSHSLLILDNVEQLLADDGAGQTARAVLEMLNRSPSLIVLCTSRRPIGLQGEQALCLNPLDVPDVAWISEAPGQEISPQALEELHQNPSVRLYLDRAQKVRPEFGLSAANAVPVAALCRLLEGSPLAIELAASWVRLLPPSRMWERLSQGLGMPEARLADLPERQRSLDAALEWSWRLLSMPQQRFLAVLSVFRGGWDLEAAESVCAAPDALALLADLQEASLVTVSEPKGSEARYRLLESVRAFCRRRLEESGQTENIHLRHAQYFQAFADRAALELRGPDQAHWLDALERDHDNLRSVLDRCVADVQGREAGLRLIAAVAPFWRTRSYLLEGHGRCIAVLGASENAERNEARVDALNAAGHLASLIAEYADAERLHREALEIACEREYLSGEAGALLGLGAVSFWRRDFESARRLNEESLTKRCAGSGSHAAAMRLSRWEEAAAHHNLGNVALRLQDYAEARRQFSQALDLRRRDGDLLGVAGTLGALGQVALAQSEYQVAAKSLLESQELFNSFGQRWTEALCLTGLSQIAEDLQQYEPSVQLLSAATAARKNRHFPIPPAEQLEFNERLQWLTEQLGASVFHSAWAKGQVMTWEQASAQTAELQMLASPNSHPH